MHTLGLVALANPASSVLGGQARVTAIIYAAERAARRRRLSWEAGGREHDAVRQSAAIPVPPRPREVRVKQPSAPGKHQPQRRLGRPPPDPAAAPR